MGVHEVEDDVTNCRTEQMTKCREVTSGYVVKEECDDWLVERCTLEKKLVKKYTPETACYKEPREFCAPRGCGFKDGPVDCHDKIKTIVVDNPLETCEIEPQRMCKHVTKLGQGWWLSRSAWMFPRRSAQGPRPTPGRSRSRSLRSGATLHPRSPDSSN